MNDGSGGSAHYSELPLGVESVSWLPRTADIRQ